MSENASTTRLSLPSRSGDHPRSPQITYGELFKQFKADVYGKEVQSAATYSYMWMADQMGHVCVGILVNEIMTFGARHLWTFLGWRSSVEVVEVASLIATIVIVAAWEASTFFSSEQSAKGLFPLGRELLRDNAIIATVYMSLGAVIGFGFNIGLPGSEVVLIIACTIIAIWLAPRWLRQKIIWQKAALPYLSRLAEMEPTMGEDAAKKLQALLEKGAPPKVKPAQVVIGGPVGSGRTQLAAGIGTEFAFKNVKTRYISIQSLLESASAAKPPDFPDDSGPVNVNYWPWNQCQVIIIDDIGPLIAPQRDQHQDVLEHFQGILNDELKSVAPVLARCHTVWVIGDLSPPGKTQLAGEVLNKFAAAVLDYVQGKETLVIELRGISAAAAAGGDSARPEAAARYVSASRSGGDDASTEFSKALGSGGAK
jgi:IstB-like ATP binding protein